MSLSNHKPQVMHYLSVDTFRWSTLREIYPTPTYPHPPLPLPTPSHPYPYLPLPTPHPPLPYPPLPLPTPHPPLPTPHPSLPLPTFTTTTTQTYLNPYLPLPTPSNLYNPLSFDEMIKMRGHNPILALKLHILLCILMKS